MNIYGKVVTLRAIEERDLPYLQKWANDQNLQKMLGGWHFPISERDQKRWHESISFNSVNQRFAITLDDDKIIGTANLVSIDWQNGNAFHGMLFGEKHTRGKGYALDALMALMRFSFEEVGLQRLDSDIIEYNNASLKFYLEKAGWKKEGVRRDWYFRSGRRWDKIIIGITHKDYKEQCLKTKYWESDDAAP